MRQRIKWEKEAERLWRKLGANGSYAGFWPAVYATARAVEEPELIAYVCKGLYIETAISCGFSPGCVEKNIRRLKEKIWMYGDKELLGEIFGDEMLTGRAPENRIFIDALAAHLREQYGEKDRK